MPRRRLSEFRAKTIVSQALDLPYKGWSIDTSGDLSAQVAAIQAHGGEMVVKVDQGIKGRFKKGLVLLHISADELTPAITSLADKGYQWLIAEAYYSHQPEDERYISISYDREGMTLKYNRHGGIEVEAKADTMQRVAVTGNTDWKPVSTATGFTEVQLQTLIDRFNDQYMTFFEINPYVIAADGPHILDLAVEVDDAASFFAREWQETDFRSYRVLTPEEKAVAMLAEKSSASFALDCINPDGAIFLLLSGGGASIVAADEVYNRGKGAHLANYGEYSGNPNTEETYLYTQAVLRLLLRSNAPRKVLFIGGAVANFTDISNTFNGIIQALTEVAPDLRRQHVKVFVRRGGPRQEAGLAKIAHALRDFGLFGAVHGPTVSLPDAVNEAIKEIPA